MNDESMIDQRNPNAMGAELGYITAADAEAMATWFEEAQQVMEAEALCLDSRPTPSRFEVVAEFFAVAFGVR